MTSRGASAPAAARWSRAPSHALPHGTPRPLRLPQPVLDPL